MNARESTCLKTGFYIREWRKNGEGKENLLVDG